MSANSTNYFVVQKVSKIGNNVESSGFAHSAANAMTVQQAYNMDKKADDGLPQSGSIIAYDADYDVTGAAAFVWAAGNSHQGTGGASCAPLTTATGPQTYNCYDNNGSTGTQTYSFSQNANNYNCALSFRFQ